MASVTQRVKVVTQPRGWYLPPKLFEITEFDDNIELHENENVHAALVGLAVDYLTRFMLGAKAQEAFSISLKGAIILDKLNDALNLLENIKGLDNKSIICACKLVGFDVAFRGNIYAYRPVNEINADGFTIENIRIMVNRTISFFKKFGPIICFEPTFEGAYTFTVNAGDGDFVTHNSLCDIKVIKGNITTKHTLQILMYYVMSLHSIHKYYKSIEYLDFYNPRQNILSRLPVTQISKELIEIVEKDIICYNFDSISRNKPIDCNTNQLTSLNMEYTVQEVAHKLNVEKSILYKEIRNGNLKAVKKGNKYIISEENLQVFLKDQRNSSMIKFILIIVTIVFITLFAVLILLIYAI